MSKSAFFIRKGKVVYGPLMNDAQLFMAIQNLHPTITPDVMDDMPYHILLTADEPMSVIIVQDGQEFNFEIEYRAC